MYENTTYEVILKRMRERVSSRLDKREGSVVWDALSPAAIEFAILYIELDTLIKESFGDTASREFLILRARERGLTPYPATYAILKGVFTPKNIDVTGKRFNIGVINYVVLDKITDGEYRVQCETPGTEGNKHLGQMTPIEYIEGLQTAVLTEVLVPGEDEEDTEDFRTRYLNSFDAKAFGGNRTDYLEKVGALQGVGAVKVTPAWNHNLKPKDMIPGEEVKAWYETETAEQTGAVKTWLDTVYKAAAEKQLTVGGTVLITLLDSEFNVPSEELIQRVQTAVDPEQNAGEGYGLAPIGHVVSVKPATSTEISITTNITFQADYSWDNMQSSIEEVIKEYLLELRKGWGSAVPVVRISYIESRLLALKGIMDIKETTINGNADNLTLDEYSVPVFGSISGGGT